MLPVVSMANAVLVRFAQVLYARAVYQSRSLISIPVRIQNARSLNSQPFNWGSLLLLLLQVCLTVPFVYDSMLNLSTLFLHYPREIVSSVAHSAYSHFIHQNDVTYMHMTRGFSAVADGFLVIPALHFLIGEAVWIYNRSSASASPAGFTA